MHQEDKVSRNTGKSFSLSHQALYSYNPYLLFGSKKNVCNNMQHEKIYIISSTNVNNSILYLHPSYKHLLQKHIIDYACRIKMMAAGTIANCKAQVMSKYFKNNCSNIILSSFYNKRLYSIKIIYNLFRRHFPSLSHHHHLIASFF